MSDEFTALFAITMSKVLGRPYIQSQEMALRASIAVLHGAKKLHWFDNEMRALIEKHPVSGDSVTFDVLLNHDYTVPRHKENTFVAACKWRCILDEVTGHGDYSSLVVMANTVVGNARWIFASVHHLVLPVSDIIIGSDGAAIIRTLSELLGKMRSIDSITRKQKSRDTMYYSRRDVERSLSLLVANHLLTEHDQTRLVTDFRVMVDRFDNYVYRVKNFHLENVRHVMAKDGVFNLQRGFFVSPSSLHVLAYVRDNFAKRDELLAELRNAPYLSADVFNEYWTDLVMCSTSMPVDFFACASAHLSRAREDFLGQSFACGVMSHVVRYVRDHKVLTELRELFRDGPHFDLINVAMDAVRIVQKAYPLEDFSDLEIDIMARNGFAEVEMVLRGVWQSIIHTGKLGSTFSSFRDVYWMLMQWIQAAATKLRNVRNKLWLVYGTPVALVLRDMA